MRMAIFKTMLLNTWARGALPHLPCVFTTGIESGGWRFARNNCCTSPAKHQGQKLHPQCTSTNFFPQLTCVLPLLPLLPDHTTAQPSSSAPPATRATRAFNSVYRNETLAAPTMWHGPKYRACSKSLLEVCHFTQLSHPALLPLPSPPRWPRSFFQSKAARSERSKRPCTLPSTLSP